MSGKSFVNTTAVKRNLQNKNSLILMNLLPPANRGFNKNI